MTTLKELKDAAHESGLSPAAFKYITALESNIKEQRQDERYRAVYVPQVPMHALTIETKSLEHAAVALESIIQLSIFEFKNRVKPDYSDFAGVERWDEDEQEWESVEDEEWEQIIEQLGIKAGSTQE